MNGTADYLVDTNIIIYYLNGDEIAIDWLRKHNGQFSIYHNLTLVTRNVSDFAQLDIKLSNPFQ